MGVAALEEDALTTVVTGAGEATTLEGASPALLAGGAGGVGQGETLEGTAATVVAGSATWVVSGFPGLEVTVAAPVDTGAECDSIKVCVGALSSEDTAEDAGR